MDTTPEQVAAWMVEEVRQKGNLYQRDALDYIERQFGASFVYVNDNGNRSLSRDVIKAFRKLHGGRVAWDRDGFFWAWT